MTKLYYNRCIAFVFRYNETLPWRRTVYFSYFISYEIVNSIRCFSGIEFRYLMEEYLFRWLLFIVFANSFVQNAFHANSL